MTRLIVSVIALALAGASGCATYKIHYKNARPPGGDVREQKQAFFLWGLAGGEDVDLDALCPTGVAQIHSKKSVGDQLLSLITVGLYTPMSVEVHCAGGTARKIEGRAPAPLAAAEVH